MTRFTIEVDRETCVGDGLCCEEAPSTFKRDAEVKVYVADPSGDPTEHILAAAKCCRLEAITLRDADTGQRIWPAD
jgi:ferredoxin